jgi:hypothetical protein
MPSTSSAQSFCLFKKLPPCCVASNAGIAPRDERMGSWGQFFKGGLGRNFEPRRKIPIYCVNICLAWVFLGSKSCLKMLRKLFSPRMLTQRPVSKLALNVCAESLSWKNAKSLKENFYLSQSLYVTAASLNSHSMLDFMMIDCLAI